MAQPSNTSQFERLQGTYIRFHNRKVSELFRDINSSNQDTKRGILRNDLIMNDNDTFQIMQLKDRLMERYIDNVKFYGIPIDDYQRKVTFQPQIALHFVERQSTANQFKRQRVRMLITFRLPQFKSTTITKVNVDEIEREIKFIFPKTYSFDKGKLAFYYKDRNEGYELHIYGQNETEVKKLITDVLKIVDKTPDFNKLTKSEYTDKNLTTPQYQTILGERKKIPLQRPTATVYLRRAELKIGGNLDDTILLERYV